MVQRTREKYDFCHIMFCNLVIELTRYTAMEMVYSDGCAGCIVNLTEPAIKFE